MFGIAFSEHLDLGPQSPLLQPAEAASARCQIWEPGLPSHWLWVPGKVLEPSTLGVPAVSETVRLQLGPEKARPSQAALQSARSPLPGWLAS